MRLVCLSTITFWINSILDGFKLKKLNCKFVVTKSTFNDILRVIGISH